MQLSHAALVLLIFSSLLHLLVAAEQPRPLFMWGGDAGEEHLVSWRNSSGNRREISMTVLSSKQPTALHVHRIFDDAECDCKWVACGTHGSIRNEYTLQCSFTSPSSPACLTLQSKSQGQTCGRKSLLRHHFFPWTSTTMVFLMLKNYKMG